MGRGGERRGGGRKAGRRDVWDESSAGAVLSYLKCKYFCADSPPPPVCVAWVRPM